MGVDLTILPASALWLYPAEMLLNQRNTLPSLLSGALQQGEHRNYLLSSFLVIIFYKFYFNLIWRSSLLFFWSLFYIIYKSRGQFILVILHNTERNFSVFMKFCSLFPEMIGVIVKKSLRLQAATFNVSFIVFFEHTIYLQSYESNNLLFILQW